MRGLISKTVIVTLTVLATLGLLFGLIILVTLWLLSGTEPAPFLYDLKP